MADETTYSVTVYTGANVTSASASPSSAIASGTEVELTIACATGYKPIITVLAGGVSVTNNVFSMGEANVVLYITAELEDPGHNVSVYKGANVTTASASPATGVVEGTDVELSITCASGYAPVIEVLAGDVTISEGAFEMPDEEVALKITAVKTNLYRVLERCSTCVNGKLTTLQRNVTIVYAATGAIKEAVTGETVITDASAIEALLNAGLIEAL